MNGSSSTSGYTLDKEIQSPGATEPESNDFNSQSQQMHGDRVNDTNLLAIYARLPFDLVPYIAHAVWDTSDIPTLRACSLTCRAWHTAFRPFLFREVSFDYFDDREDPLEGFTQLLKSDTAIRYLVREVRVYLLAEESSRSTRYPPWFKCLPSFLSKNIPRVHTLEITGLGSVPFNDALGPSEEFFSQFLPITSLKRLSLVRCFIPYAVFNGLISNLPSLEELHVHNQWLDERDNLDLDNIPLPTRMPPLKCFEYHNDECNGQSSVAFARWLQEVHTLTTLGMHISGDWAIPEVGNLIRRLGKSLRHLELCFMEGYWPVNSLADLTVPIEDHIDLTYNTQLQSLHLHSLRHRWIPQLLQQACALPVCEVTISDRSRDLVYLFPRQSIIDDALSALATQISDRVTLIHQGYEDEDYVQHMVQAVLPKTTSQRAIRVLVTPSEVGFCCYR